ncbi:MAG: hypothetical protein AAFQ20_14165, partial [Bacteroidota bacterium]
LKLASELRQFIINVVATKEGHLGASFSRSFLSSFFNAWGVSICSRIEAKMIKNKNTYSG